MNCSLFQHCPNAHSSPPPLLLIIHHRARHKLSSLIMIISFRQRNAFTFLFVLKLVLLFRFRRHSREGSDPSVVFMLHMMILGRLAFFAALSNKRK